MPYSWILSNHLAIGPMPRTEAHWQQLEEAGFKARFSCCYPEEQRFAPIPPHWKTAGVAIPDHREQETLTEEKLFEAIQTAENLLKESYPIYLHCLAGRERSSLMAIALTARSKKIDIFSSLDWVRRCHPAASPLYDQLELLEMLLKKN
ncbi:MAG: hypothetical protein ACK5FE_13765 [Cyanobacteriota bacterium]